MKITLTLWYASLWPNDDPLSFGVDEHASAACYRDLWLERVQDAFPDAEVDIDASEGSLGQAPPPEIELDEGEDQYEEAVIATIAAISQELFTSGDWVVDLPATAAS